MLRSSQPKRRGRRDSDSALRPGLKGTTNSGKTVCESNDLTEKTTPAYPVLRESGHRVSHFDLHGKGHVA